LLEALSVVSGASAVADPVFAPERVGEVRRSCLVVEQAKTALDWQAQVGLRHGLGRILAGL
jgi:UDP-glucose 4-epimerase